MVKLRSRRLIRSPFSGGDVLSSATSTGASGEEQSESLAPANEVQRGGNNNNARQRQGGNARGRDNNQGSSQQGGATRRSQRLQSNSNNDASESSSSSSSSGEEDQRRPFEALDTSSERLRSSAIASPGNKRKPESRGITASIRRAKTAMFRMASSPMTSSRQLGGDGAEGVGNVGAAARASSSAVDDDDERMDTSDDGDESYASPIATLNFHRSPSQEENVPPLALLSPNCGTFYAHAAGASSNNACKRDDSNAMDVDDSEATSSSAAAASQNVLQWMEEEAPPELLPKLLSFCGSRKMNALSRVNKSWNAVMKDESVWRVLCEDTHKWSDGEEVPSSWSQFYKQNPCVPIDYDTVEAAFDSISTGPRRDTVENNVLHQYREQRKTCRILLHPGPYFLRKPLVANVLGNAELTIESIGNLKDAQHGMTWRQNYHKGTSNGSETSMEEESSSSSSKPLLPGDYAGTRTARRPSSPTLRQIFGCGRRSSSASAASAVEGEPSSSGSEHDATSDTSQSANRADFHQSCFQGPPGRPTALLCLETGRENEPVIRIRQGTLNIRGLKFVHYCEGTDIWNGNAAIQVQRAFGRNGRPLRVEPPSYVVPTANIVDCDIVSLSGRGLVVIDGAVSSIHDCNFHDSAATGVYVGGAGSVATLTRTDVVDNGTGNSRNPRRGVARGHSGVYVEQGLAKVDDCNISGNTLTGISAISTEQARLHIQESDIRSNRTDQMELPSAESGRSVNRNNIIARTGPGRPRSRRLRESQEVATTTPRGRTGQIEPPTPQSPLEDF